MQTAITPASRLITPRCVSSNLRCGAGALTSTASPSRHAEAPKASPEPTLDCTLCLRMHPVAGSGLMLRMPRNDGSHGLHVHACRFLVELRGARVERHSDVLG